RRAYDKAEREYAAAMAGKLPAQEHEQVRSRRGVFPPPPRKGPSPAGGGGPRPAPLPPPARPFPHPPGPQHPAPPLPAPPPAHRRADPDDPQLPIWEAESRWLAKDHAGTARLLQKHRKALLADGRHRWKFYPRLLASLVKLKRADEARKEAAGLLRGSDADRQ